MMELCIDKPCTNMADVEKDPFVFDSSGSEECRDGDIRVQSCMKDFVTMMH